jgi:hypoxanthine-guanine phosphoribosyltransferase
VCQRGGLDFNGYYRNYPEIAVLKPELIPSR